MVAIPGDMSGNIILWKMRSSPAPSILAASNNAGDKMDSKYCFRKNTVPADAIAGTINGI